METLTITDLAPPSLDQRLESNAAADNLNDKEKFSDWLRNSLSQISEMQQSADESAQKLITGESEDVHGTMIAMEKASVAFDLVMQIRNKIISAYEEIQRMQL